MIPTVLLHENTCTFCRNPFLTNAVARPHCPRCTRLLRTLRARDALRARFTCLAAVVVNLLYDVAHPRETLRMRRVEA